MKSPNVGFYVGAVLAIYLLPGVSFLSVIVVFLTAIVFSVCWRFLLFEKVLQLKAEDTTKGRAVLITGTSSGFGRLFTQRLASLGFTVYATVRKEKDATALIESLPVTDRQRVHTLVMDVTKQDEIDAAAKLVTEQLAASKRELYAVVNNAGVVVVDPLEVIDINKVQKGFDVNVMGNIRVTNAFLPLLRQHNQSQLKSTPSRIVFLGSIAGHTTNPYGGPYSATKHAVEAIADAYRLEIREWNIKVTVLEPGAFKTNLFHDTAPDMTGFPSLGCSEEELGGPLYAKAWGRGVKLYTKVQKGMPPPTAVVAQLEKTLLAKIPPYRSIVGKDAIVLIFLHRIMPEAVLYFFIPRLSALVPVD